MPKGACHTGCRPIAILAVDGDHPRGQDSKGLYRISGSIEDHVCRVEIDPEVLPVGIIHEIQQDMRRFLTGFESEGLAAGVGGVADAAHHLANGDVIRIGGRFGNETNMGGNTGRADGSGEFTDRQGALFALFPRGWRNEARGLSVPQSFRPDRGQPRT